MTDQQIDFAIAEALGWTVKMSDLQSGLDMVKDGVLTALPSYSTDLNAMHQAEKALLELGASVAYWKFYVTKLLDHVAHEDIFHATARQRAEALLKTIGKWEVPQP